VSQLGALVGVGKQGVLHRIDRLQALLRYDRPDEKITRAARRAERERCARLPVEEDWLAARRDELRSVISGLVNEADRLGAEERDWVEELEIDWREDQVTSATMVILGLATAGLRTAPAVVNLGTTRPCAVHTVLARADELRSRFAELGASTPRRAAAS